MSSLKIRVDKLSALLKGINELTRKDVLVGVPEADAERKDDDPINNATLAYIHDNGSPAANIPARPFMRPGIAAVEEKIASRLKRAANAAIDGQTQKIEPELEAAGMIAQASIKKTITDGEFAPLAPSTVANRFRSRQTASKRDAELEYAEMIRDGVPAELAQGVAGIQPLNNTGQMRNSVNYVVRGKK